MNQLCKFIALMFLVAGSFAAPVEVEVDEEHANSNLANPEDIADVEGPMDRIAAVLHVGQATFFDAGLGSCGVTNNGEAQDIVALPHAFMGPQSNGNPYCGRRVRISHGGKTATGTIQDKCMGCAGKNIDLSKHLFKKFAPLSTGRLHGVQWDLV